MASYPSPDVEQGKLRGKREVRKGSVEDGGKLFWGKDGRTMDGAQRVSNQKCGTG